MDLLTKIINEKIPCYFISPHLDDAIFSAGGLINYLSDKTKVTIITVFTKAGPKPYTRFCKKFMKDCGFSDADIFFRERRSEDIEVCKSLGINFTHLGFADVAWRKKENPSFFEKTLGTIIPEFLHLYPLGRNFMSGKVVKDDGDLIKTIKNKLSSVILNLVQDLNSKKQMPKQVRHDNFIVFCPLAIGNHVDHIIVRNICAEIFPLEKLIFWTDFPYINWGNTAEGFIKKMKLRSFTWNKNLEKKRELLLGFKTQIPALFPKSLPENLPEVYYLKF